MQQSFPMNSRQSESSLIQRHLEIIPVPELGDGIFKNAYPLWHPSGARGIFGGIAIAQSLNAAQATISDEKLHAHSMHLSFLNAGREDTDIFYQVTDLRRGKSFISKSVKAVQKDRTLAISTISFARMSVGSRGGNEGVISHAEPMPKNVPRPEKKGDEAYEQPSKLRKTNKVYFSKGPYINWSLGVVESTSPDLEPRKPYQKRIHQWIKARDLIASSSSSTINQYQHRIHLAALAYMSDSYFLAAVPHASGIFDFVSPPLTEFYMDSEGPAGVHKGYTKIPRPYLQDTRTTDKPSHSSSNQNRVGMMVSLDHTIYFHCPRGFQADEWMLAEVQNHWAGEGRGLITQKIWSRDGTLIATCIQEVSY
jgi:acyl-coenzyme A thioesterase 1/2/4